MCNARLALALLDSLMGRAMRLTDDSALTMGHGVSCDRHGNCYSEILMTAADREEYRITELEAVMIICNNA